MSENNYHQVDPILTVAIVGAGPGGLATAIALGALPFVRVRVYEKADRPREAGAGISIGPNGWRVLRLLGAADGVVGWAGEGGDGGEGAAPCHRNGYNGRLVVPPRNKKKEDASNNGLPPSIRTRRTVLQRALLARVPDGVIEYSKKLVAIVREGEGEKTENRNTDKDIKTKKETQGTQDEYPQRLSNHRRHRGAILFFADGSQTRADLVVAADGLHSVVRRSLFPEHKMHFTGNTAWRTLVPRAVVRHLDDVVRQSAWWHGEHGYTFFSGVDPPETPEAEALFEVTARTLAEPAEGGGPDRTPTVIWGIPANNEAVRGRFEAFDPRVRAALAAVPDTNPITASTTGGDSAGAFRQFAMFAGPCLSDIVGWDCVAIVGDASHPLSGAFGSGAAFAMEDGWLLARALEREVDRAAKGRKARGGEIDMLGDSQQQQQQQGDVQVDVIAATAIPAALATFSAIRNPYYARMFAHLDRQHERFARWREEQTAKAKTARKAQTQNQGADQGNSAEEAAALDQVEFEERLRARLGALFRSSEREKGNGQDDDGLEWIYQNDIAATWAQYLAASA